MKFKRLFIGALAIILFSGLTSCMNSSDPETVVQAEVFITVKPGSEGNTLYALSIQAIVHFAKESLVSVVVTKPDGDELILKPEANQWYCLYDSPFSGTKPLEGTYFIVFNLTNTTFPAQQYTLSGNVIFPPDVTSCTVSGFSSVNLEWTGIDNATFYEVFMYDSNDKQIFVSSTPTSRIGGTATSYIINPSAGTWSGSINDGRYVEVVAYYLQSGFMQARSLSGRIDVPWE